MIWTIDTGSAGAYGVAPSSLKAFLEAEVGHHNQTVVKQAGADVYRTAGPAPADPAALMEHHAVLSTKVEKAKKTIEARLPDVQEQMKVGIEAACLLASRHTKNVCVVITGHFDPNHASGVPYRISVAVDEAPHVADAP